MSEYIAFISYRHMPLDAAVARKLHRLIERYRVPAKLAEGLEGRRLGRVFRDQDELPLSSDLSSSICEALDHTRFLIVVCTSDTPKSIWVQREISYFLERHDRNRVLAVLADGRPEEAFPDRLVHVYDADGNVIADTEPLAANIVGGSAREALRKLDSEALRLFAALIGCPYDALYRREHRYRVRRLTIAASTVLLAGSVFIGMLLVKNREITARNQELVRQKRRIQISESTLLTQSAMEALEIADDAGAIRGALAALPDGADDDKPYYAPAERALLSALRIYKFDTSPAAFVAETEVALQSPIGDFKISEAGDVLFAVDNYGGAAAFNPVSGELLWRTAGDVESRSAFAPNSTRLLLTQSGVIDVCGRTIICFERDTGRALWRHELEIFMPSAVELSEDGSRLAVMDYEVRISEDGTGFRRDYRIDILDTRDGGTVCSVPLKSVDESHLLGFSADIYGFSHGEFRDGLFIDGDNRFISTYLEDGELNICEVDLQKKTWRTLAAWTTDALYEPVIGLWADSSRESLYVFQRDRDSSVAATCVKLDLDSGEELWRSRTNGVEGYSFGNNAECFLLAAKHKLLFCANDRLCALDMETGECVASVKLQSEMADMFSIDENQLFGYVLKDGYYAAGWLNDTGFFDSRASRNVFFRLGRLERAASMKLGFIRPVFRDNLLDDFEIGDEAQGFGAIVVVPEDNEHALRVKSLLPSGEITAQQTIPFPDEDASLNSGDIPPLTLVGDSALLTETGRDADGTMYRCVRLDTQTHEILKRTDYRFSEPGSRWLLPDGSGILWMDYGVAAHCYSFSDGTDRVLAGENRVIFEPKEGYSFILVASEGDANYQTTDGSLLAAHCDGETLHWWLNAVEQGAEPLPKDMTWLTRVGVIYEKCLRVGGNGLVLLSDYETDAEMETMKAFVAYDTRADRWYSVEDAAHGNAGRVMALGKEKPLLAVMDADRTLRVYDLARGALETSLSIDLPQNYVREIQFAFADRYLMLRMEDSQLALLDLESGECVFRGTLEQSYRIDTVISTDSAGLRAYFIDRNSRKGLVLDTRQWELLAELNDVCGFDPGRDELYLCSYSSGLVIRRIPDLDALIQAGKKLADTEERLPDDEAQWD